MLSDDKITMNEIQIRRLCILSYKNECYYIIVSFAGRNNASPLKCIWASNPYFYLIAKTIKFHEKHLFCPIFSKLRLCTSGHEAKVHHDDEKHSAAISF